MKSKIFHSEHGVARRVLKTGDIVIGTFKNENALVYGEGAGLQIRIRPKNVRVSFFKENKNLAKE